MRKLILLLLAAACPLAAIEYNVNYDVASGTSNVITIQQPATGARSVRGKFVEVYCSVTCDVEIERDGTAASATETTIVAVDRNAANTTPKFKAYHTSNVGNGTTLYLRPVPTGGSIVLEMDSVFLNGNGTAKNWTVRVTAGSSGRLTINLKVDEY